jgi:hypothetical protein
MYVKSLTKFHFMYTKALTFYKDLKTVNASSHKH